MDEKILARNGESVRIGDICVFATLRGTEVMKITGMPESGVVSAKGVTDSGRRWTCNILRHATEEEIKLLMERLDYERAFSEWYNKNIKRNGRKEDLRQVQG